MFKRLSEAVASNVLSCKDNASQETKRKLEFKQGMDRFRVSGCFDNMPVGGASSVFKQNCMPVIDGDEKPLEL